MMSSLFFSSALLLLLCLTVYQVLCDVFLLTSHWFMFLTSAPITFMMSFKLLFLLLLLCLTIYQIFCIADLEHDLINPYDLAERIKGLITKEYMDRSYCIDIIGVVFSVLQCGKQYWMFELGVCVVVFLIIAFTNSYNEETEDSLESTGASGHLYDLIYFTEIDWHIHTDILDLDQHIVLGDIEGIWNVIAPFVVEGGDNVTIQYLAEEDNQAGQDNPVRTLMNLIDLLAFHGEYRIIEFYAYPSYMVWDENQSKYIAVDRSEVDGAVIWIDISGTVALPGLRNEVIYQTGEIPPGSMLLWASAKGELEELDFVITGGDMWRVWIYAVMKVFVHPAADFI